MILHFPTLMLVIGYAVVWLEIYVFKNPPGQTSILATILALLTCFIIVFKERESIRRGWTTIRDDWSELTPGTKKMFSMLLVVALPILVLAVFSGILPPHLMPEADALNYHYTLPRQHLIRHSFAHIPWSTADLFPLPVQFALSPYWFVSALPNKIPQLFFMVGLWGLVFHLTYRLASRKQALSAALLSTLAVITSHGFAIQYGSAMLDVILCYLAIAALDSILDGHWIMAGLEFAFFVWAKIPLLYSGILLSALFCVLGWRACGGSIGWGFEIDHERKAAGLAKIAGTFVVFSFLIGGPFATKSMRYAGTPIFPMFTGSFASLTPDAMQRLPVIQNAARRLWDTAHGGNDDRSWKGLMTHFFLLAVPTQGVNNSFDYPLGLPYLVFLIPFVMFSLAAIRRGFLPIFPLLAIMFWAAWWLSSHQARFLYIPVVLMFICVSTRPAMLSAWGPRTALFIAALLTSLSMYRGNRDDFGKSRWQVLRHEDQELIRKAETLKDLPTEPLPWPEKEVAFATFPVAISHGDIFVLPESSDTFKR